MRACMRAVRPGTIALSLFLLTHLVFPYAGAAQSGLIGTVVARATGQPIAGATITVEGSNVTATTNGLGRFEVGAAPGSATLVVSAPGYLELRVSNVQSGTTIELERTPNFLETVQVTATKGTLSVGDVAAPTSTATWLRYRRRGDLNRRRQENSYAQDLSRPPRRSSRCCAPRVRPSAT